MKKFGSYDIPIAWNLGIGGVCSVDGCEKVHYARTFCKLHYSRVIQSGKDAGPIDRTTAKKGERRHHIRGGYIAVSDPRGRRGNYGVLEHRLVYEQFLGRELLPHENIHHVNGVRDDNRLENLELWSTSQPRGQRVEDKVAWAHEIIKLYENRNKKE
jgi:hypothetical protein